MKTMKLFDPTFDINPAAVEVSKRVRPVDEKKVLVSYCRAMYNGRERGVCFSVTPRLALNAPTLRVFVAEDRNSDEIVIWAWTGYDWKETFPEYARDEIISMAPSEFPAEMVKENVYRWYLPGSDAVKAAQNIDKIIGRYLNVRVTA